MQNTYYKIKIILFFSLIFIAQFSYAESGRRKHFLSHGPSITAFGAGETVFAALNDPAVVQYNSSLMYFFKENGVSLSRFNLYEGSSYNSASIAYNFSEVYSVGLSASNLSSGDIMLRDTIYSTPQNISTNIWDYVVSLSGFSKLFGFAYGVNIKYVFMDFYIKSGGTFAADAGVSKLFNGPQIFDSKTKIFIGLSAQNFLSGEMKIDSKTDDIPGIYRISSSFIVPVYYRFKTQDTLSIYADLKYEDEFLDFYSGAAYRLAGKYVARVGYYPEHLTFGFGVEFFSFVIDYAADFGEVDLINRFGLMYKWGSKKNDELAQEAKAALNKEKIALKEAERRFNNAKRFYNKGEYLRATDMLSEIVVSYPNYESPLHFYKKISDNMQKTAESKDELDFSKLTYARGYCAYYAADYQTSLNEWNKYTQFSGENNEITEYFEKINNAMKLEKLKQYETEMDAKASAILQQGIKFFNSAQWVKCIKKMENLQKFVSKNNFSKTIEYYSTAKEYISKAVIELSKSIESESCEVKNKETESEKEEKAEIDTEGADKKYNEGLVLYAQGKYFEAERTWELTLRLNPNHQKAKVALSKIRESSRLAQ